MKIVLRTDVESLGKKGDLVEVAPTATPATTSCPAVSPSSRARAPRSRPQRCVATARSRDGRAREAAQNAARTLVATPVQVSARAGEAGKLFGSVTSTDIADGDRVGQRA